MAVGTELRSRIQSGMRCGATGGVERYRASDFLFRSPPNYALLSWILAALSFAASSAAEARIINASSPSLADVRAAIASAADGDTVIVPAGTAAWTSGLTITKGITIQGQTTVNSDTGVCNDQTILIDDLVDVPGGQGFFHCTTAPGKSLRITGLTFSGPGNRGTTIYNGAIRFSGGSDQVRIDHCHATGQLKHSNFIAVYGGTYGVADHIVEDNLLAQMCQNRVFNGINNGDEEFAAPADYGSNRFWFFEDFYINNTAGPFTASGGVDCNWGGKFVVRHCHLYDVEILCHGTEDGRKRGGRAQEIYNNDYHWSYLTTMDGIRTGTLIAHDNTYVGIKPRGYGMQYYRFMFGYTSGTWKGASGDNAWDYNATEPDGTHVDGHPPCLFASGTFTSGTGGNTLIDSSKNWVPNQWTHYSVKRTSDGATAIIDTNSSNMLHVIQWQSQGFASGQGYQIHKVIAAIDQPGRGAGDLITGDNPTPAWAHQVIEGCYSWNNVYTPDGSHINWAISPSSTWALQEGRDYFSDTPMPGYTPYTYPHPLTRSQLVREPKASSPQQPWKKRKKWGKAKKTRNNEMAQPESVASPLW
jgi:hypothetical protein